MKIIDEGLILIGPDGDVTVRGFRVAGENSESSGYDWLQCEVERRVLRAADRIRVAASPPAGETEQTNKKEQVDTRVDATGDPRDSPTALED